MKTLIVQLSGYRLEGMWQIRLRDLPKTNSSGSHIVGSRVRFASPWYRNSDVMKPYVSTLDLCTRSNAIRQSVSRKLGVIQFSESIQRTWVFSEVLFAVETAGVVDAARFQGVVDSADTLMVIKARMTDKAAETMMRDDFMACSRRGSVNAVWRTVFQLTPAVEGSDKASSMCSLCNIIYSGI